MFFFLSKQFSRRPWLKASGESLCNQNFESVFSVGQIGTLKTLFFFDPRPLAKFLSGKNIIR